MKFVLFTLIFLNTTAFSQSLKTSNIHYRIIENKIEIFYDLPAKKDSLNVSIAFYKKSEPKFKYYPKFVSGAIGIGKFSGANKKITWYYKKEPAYVFTGKGFYFDVTATKIPNSDTLITGQQ